MHRRLLEWEWIGDPNVVAVFVQIILRANRKPRRWQGIDIQPGSFITSREKIAEACGLTEKQVRRALEVLKGADTITTGRAGLGQLISLRKWEEYQDEPTENGRTRAEDGAGRGPEQGRTRAGTKEGRESGEGENVRTTLKGGADGQLPIDGMPQNPTAPSRKGPDPAVQAVIDHLTAAVIDNGIAPALDGSVAKNRQYARLLLNKLAKDYSGFDPVDVAKRLVNFAMTVPYHATRCTKVAFLYYNAGSLAGEAQARRSNPKTQTNGDRTAELSARIEQYAREQSAGDV